jgi:VanZ family protein
MRAARPLLRWASVAVYSGLIFFLSSQSDPHFGHHELLFDGVDKLEHLGAYGLWAFLFAAALRATRPGIRLWPLVLLTFLAGVLYGASDEVHQRFVPEREADLADLAADSAGALLGGLAYSALAYRNRRRGSAAPPAPASHGAGGGAARGGGPGAV